MKVSNNLKMAKIDVVSDNRFGSEQDMVGCATPARPGHERGYASMAMATATVVIVACVGVYNR